MKLINFRGLNCYSNSIVSIANDLGIDYAAAFRELWSERDFYYQPDREAYLSKRLPTALEALGIKLVMQLCDLPDQAEELLSRLKKDEPVVLGMDAFYVPWSQFSGLFHAPHFFAARYTGGEIFTCFDPTFEKAGVQISRADIIAHAYDISRMLPVAQKLSDTDPLADVREVLHTLPEMRRTLFENSEICEKERCAKPAKYIEAITNNRYLYRYYLEHLPAPYENKHLFMDDSFFSKWSAVKNGLYKAQVSKDNKAIIAEVRVLLSQLMDMELTMAERILQE